MIFKNKKVLISGGAGVIGHELVKLLREQGAIIRVVDLADKPKDYDDIDYFRLDLSVNNIQILFRFEPDYVFHLAADFERSTETTGFWESNFRNNVLASHYLISEISKIQNLKKIIFASSYLVYDKKLYNFSNKENFLDENSQINPRNLCGIAKLQTEIDLEFISNFSNIKHACARIFRVFGKNDRAIISRWIRDILDGKEISVFSENNVFDYIYAKDVALGLLKLADNRAEGVYNLGTGKGTKISEVVKILQAKLGEFPIKRSDEVIFEESSIANMSKFKKDMDWVPNTPIELAISEIIDYERNKR